MFTLPLGLENTFKAGADITFGTIKNAEALERLTGAMKSSISGVIGSGAKIMDIVPQNDELIIEAQVMPKDIESIKVGLSTKVQLSAYKSRY